MQVPVYQPITEELLANLNFLATRRKSFSLCVDLDFGPRANAQKGNFYIQCSWHIIQSNVESWFVCLVIFWGELQGHNAETFGLD